jgi:hypothetical protein
MSTTESDGEGVENMRGLLPSWVGPSERPAVLEVSKGGKVMTSLSLDTAPIVSLGRSAEKVSQHACPTHAHTSTHPSYALPEGLELMHPPRPGPPSRRRTCAFVPLVVLSFRPPPPPLRPLD